MHGIGMLDYWYPEGLRVDAVLDQARDGFHQIGTTRMAADPGQGVTDSYGRVFGTSNLFVCSSSVFPTSGQANPTLTLLAFAIRQASHIGRCEEKDWKR
jgi:choline dehydrogenase-like flavoprotein